MNAEGRLRHAMRSRAYDLRAAVPEGLELAVPLEEVCEDEGVEVVVIVRRRQPPAPPPAPVLSARPVQRYLAGCWLTDVEKAIVAALLDVGNDSRAMPWVRGQLDARLARAPSEGALKQLLARLADPAVGVLESRRRRGYRVRTEYVAFLAWVEAARKSGWLPAADAA